MATVDVMRSALIALLAVIAACAAYFVYRDYTQRYAVTVEDDGRAVTRVIAATLRDTSELKVSTLSGTVQSSAADARLWGMLQSDQVVKAPFTVDYLVDLRRLGARDLSWDANRRTLTVDVPDIVTGQPNIDLGHRTLVQTRGLVVTRGAAEELARRVSLGASRAATVEATRPKRIAQAREAARRAIGALLSAPLAAAGLRATMDVRFPDERNRSTEQWDRSRSPTEILGNAH